MHRHSGGTAAHWQGALLKDRASNRLGVTARRVGQAGIKDTGHDPDQTPTGGADRDAGAIYAAKAFCRQETRLIEAVIQSVRLGVKARAYLSHVDGQVAHDPLDGGGANSVIVGED